MDHVFVHENTLSHLSELALGGTAVELLEILISKVIRC